MHNSINPDDIYIYYIALNEFRLLYVNIDFRKDFWHNQTRITQYNNFYVDIAFTHHSIAQDYSMSILVQILQIFIPQERVFWIYTDKLTDAKKLL